MNEQLLTSYYADYCETLLAIRRSGEWKDWSGTWEEYVGKRWSLSKSRAKLLCQFAKLRAMCHVEHMRLPETPEQVKAILALPQKQWLETWDLVTATAGKDLVNAAHVDAVMTRFHIYARKRLSPEAMKAIRVRRAAKTMAEMEDGERLVGEIGGKALGKNWNKAVEVVIEADQARLNERGTTGGA